MTYEQYWFGDPLMTRAYAQAYLLKRKVRNEEMWIEGIYFANALQTVLDHAFNKHSTLTYLDKPLDIFPKTQAEKEQEIRAERQKLINWLNQMRQSADLRQGVDEDGSKP